MKKIGLPAILIALLLVTNSCEWLEEFLPDLEKPTASLIEVAHSDKQWTGVAVSEQNRIFVNYPNWSPAHTISVAEVTDTASVKPFPNEAWNTWNESLDPAQHFVCVQAMWAEGTHLWVLDPANPQRNGKNIGVVSGGAKLIEFDLATGEVVKKYVFAAPAITPDSYLNDVRFDFERGYAYLTDSNEGALVVLNLATGEARRVLANHYSTKSENKIIEIDGIVWRNPDGSLPSSDADAIALDKNKEYLYYQALTSKTLYRIATTFLRDASLPDADRESKVEKVGQAAVVDGILFGPDSYLYLTDLENKAISRYRAGGKKSLLAKDNRLKWPDTFAQGPDGYLYVTTSQIHIPNPTEPYRLFKIKLP